MDKRLRYGLRVLLTAVVVVIGTLAVIAGEFDDSPGLQGLGVILICAQFTLMYRTRLR